MNARTRGLLGKKDITRTLSLLRPVDATRDAKRVSMSLPSVVVVLSSALSSRMIGAKFNCGPADSAGFTPRAGSACVRARKRVFESPASTRMSNRKCHGNIFSVAMLREQLQQLKRDAVSRLYKFKSSPISRRR